MSKVVDFVEETKGLREPILAELLAAFQEVFPEETLQSVEVDHQPERAVFTVQSNLKTRTYLRDPERPISELFRNTPEIDVSKVF